MSSSEWTNTAAATAENGLSRADKIEKYEIPRQGIEPGPQKFKSSVCHPLGYREISCFSVSVSLTISYKVPGTSRHVPGAPRVALIRIYSNIRMRKGKNEWNSNFWKFLNRWSLYLIPVGNVTNPSPYTELQRNCKFLQFPIIKRGRGVQVPFEIKLNSSSLSCHCNKSSSSSVARGARPGK